MWHHTIEKHGQITLGTTKYMHTLRLIARYTRRTSWRRTANHILIVCSYYFIACFFMFKLYISIYLFIGFAIVS